jgi:DNA-binding MarR family transcriptional regulator
MNKMPAAHWRRPSGVSSVRRAEIRMKPRAAVLTRSHGSRRGSAPAAPAAPARAGTREFVAELEADVGYVLRRAQLAVFADFTLSQRGPVSRPGQFAVLTVIGRHPGLSQAQLCEALSIKRANLVAVLDHFEALGLARREACADDRRANRLYLTPLGERALQTAREAQREHEARITQALGSAGRRELLVLLEKLRALGER